MKRKNLNQEWEFQWGEPSNIPMMPVEKKTVNLPYDFMITKDVSKDAVGGAETGFYQGGKASYTKYITVNEEDKKEIHILSFDGCYGTTKVVVNGHVACRHHYGYTPFQVRLDSYLQVGKNRITVTVDNTSEPNSRWYSGAGLYRGAELLTGGPVYVLPEGIYTYTESIGQSAIQIVETSIKNETDAERKIAAEICLVEKATEKTVAEHTELLSISAGEERTIKQEFDIQDPILWNVDTPYLYEAKICIQDTGKQELYDSASASFGIRRIEVDAKQGFRLNGVPMKLKGGCIHHDNGILGAAAFKESEYRKVLLHKKAGFNALRFAHNPPSKELLNACDEIGMLVIDEAFDVWNMEKNYHDFSNFFEYEWEKELRAMILRDRNHPSIFMWSIGNELPEQGGLSEGYETSGKLAEYTRKWDKTRPVGGALCSFFRGLDDEDNAKYWKSVMEEREKLQQNGMVNLDCEFGKTVWDPYTAPFVEAWDIVGYNYLQYQYEPSHEKHPERVICCTESKPRELGTYWAEVERLPYVIGDFEWTSMDYIGEAGIGNSFYVKAEEVPQMRQRMFHAQYPARTAETGDFDICGFEKSQLGYRKCVWGSPETFLVSYDPSVFDQEELLGRYGWGKCERSWSWQAEAGAPIKVEVYSRAPFVEIFVNGISIGKKAAGKDHDYRAVFVTTFEPGEILAVSYDEEGREISRDRQCTAGKPAGVAIREDETLKELKERGFLSIEDSLRYYVVEVVDENGNLVPYAEEKLSAEDLKTQDIKEILAFGTGRPTTEENYTRGEITTYRGRALLIAR